jgi:hypothetical protein
VTLAVRDAKRYTLMVRLRLLLPIVLSLATPSLAAAAVEVQVNRGRVDVKTGGAPLAEVLERMERTVGFKVERQGSPPNPLVPALEIHDRTPVEAILAILEGLGLNYAISLDDTGLRVEKLVLIGAPPVAGRGQPTSRAPAPRFPTVEAPPPEEPFDEPADEPGDIPDDTPDASPAELEPPPTGQVPDDGAGGKQPPVQPQYMGGRLPQPPPTEP